MKYLSDFFEEPIRSFDFKISLNLASLEYDVSPTATSNSENAVSNIEQIYDGRKLENKWFLLDGYCLLDGNFKLLPSTQNEIYEIGYMSGEVSQTDGTFTTSPYVEISFIPRPLQDIQLVFDDLKDEYPTDLTIELYDNTDTLLVSENISNSSAELNYSFSQMYYDVAKMKIIFNTWNKANTVAKLSETFLSAILEFENERLLGANVKEKLYSQTGLGGIIAREIDVNLANHDKLLDNYQDYLTPNRNLRAYIRAKSHGFSTSYYRAGTKEYNGFTYQENEPIFEKDDVLKYHVLLLDGTDYLEIPSDFLDFQNKSFTIEAIINTSESDIQPIFVKYGSYQEIKEVYFYLQQGLPTIEFFGNEIKGNSAVNDGNWHYLAFVWDNENNVAKLVVDNTVEEFSYLTLPDEATAYFTNSLLDNVSGIYPEGYTPTATDYENYIGKSEEGNFIGKIANIKVSYITLNEVEYTKNAVRMKLEYDKNTAYLFNLQEYAGQTWIPLGEFFVERFKFKKSVVNIYAKDRFKFLVEKEYFAELKQNQNIQAILEEVLDYAGIDSQKRVFGDLDGYVLPYVFLNKDVASIVQSLVEVIEFYAYFDNWDYKLHIDNTKETLGEIGITVDKSEARTLLVNRIETSFSTFDEENNMTPKAQRWNFDVDVGTTRMRLDFDGFLTNVNFSVNSAPSDATINVLQTDIAGIEIEINTPNAGTVDVSVNANELAIVRSNIVKEDVNSISKYGLKPAKVDFTNVANAVQYAQILADNIITNYSDANNLLELRYRGNAYLKTGQKFVYNKNEYILMENVLYFKGGLQGRLKARKVV